MAIRSSILVLFLFCCPLSVETPWTEEPGGYSSWGGKEPTRLSTQARTTSQHLLHRVFWALLSGRRDGKWLATFLADQL